MSFLNSSREMRVAFLVSRLACHHRRFSVFTDSLSLSSFACHRSWGRRRRTPLPAGGRKCLCKSSSNKRRCRNIRAGFYCRKTPSSSRRRGRCLTIIIRTITTTRNNIHSQQHQRQQQQRQQQQQHKQQHNASRCRKHPSENQRSDAESIPRRTSGPKSTLSKSLADAESIPRRTSGPMPKAFLGEPAVRSRHSSEHLVDDAASPVDPARDLQPQAPAVRDDVLLPHEPGGFLPRHLWSLGQEEILYSKMH